MGKQRVWNCPGNPFIVERPARSVIVDCGAQEKIARKLVQERNSGKVIARAQGLRLWRAGKYGIKLAWGEATCFFVHADKIEFDVNLYKFSSFYLLI